jgi:hypothetical protein
LEACRTEDRPAAQVIREFMRDYVAQHASDMNAPPARAPRSGPRQRKQFSR